MPEMIAPAPGARSRNEKPLTEYDFFKKICAFPYVRTVYLYGSRARGDDDARSDYDLAIDCPAASAEEWNAIVYLLEEAAFLNHIEAVRYDRLQDGLFKERIDRDKKVLYAQD